MNIPITNPSRELEKIRDFKTRINREISQGIYIGGNNVNKFENNLRKFLNCKYVVTLNSGTDALYLSLVAMKLKKNDEVLLPSFTFFATVECVLNVGAKPIFVDIDESTYCMDLNDLRKKITKKSKVIIPVHLFGNNSSIKEILKIGKSKNIKVLEDCAQSFGSKTIDNEYLGTLGDIGAFSFYPSKTLGGIGDGGMIATNNKNYYNLISQLKNHGLKGTNHQLVGTNSRLDSINAFVLNEKLNIFSDILKTRNIFYEYYMEQLSDLSFLNLPKKENPNILFNYFTISTKKISDRNKLMMYLNKNNITTSIYYKKPIHLQPALKGIVGRERLDKTELASKSVLSLPLYPFPKNKEMEKVVKTISNFSS